MLLLTVSSRIYIGFRGVLTALSDSGFETGHVLTMSFDPILTHYKDAQERQFYCSASRAGASRRRNQIRDAGLPHGANSGIARGLESQ